jgi:hypothetical protein
VAAILVLTLNKAVKKTKALKQKISCCIARQIIPKVWKGYSAFIFRVKMYKKNEGK